MKYNPNDIIVPVAIVFPYSFCLMLTPMGSTLHDSIFNWSIFERQGMFERYVELGIQYTIDEIHDGLDLCVSHCKANYHIVLLRLEYSEYPLLQ